MQISSLVFRRRTHFGWGMAESCVLLFSAILICWTAAHHEPWADEAQSWLIARDLPLSRIFLHQLHHEGTPGLWHLLLYLEARCHISYAGMHWIAAAMGIGTISLFLRYSTLPSLFRFILPFTVAFAYQAPVVARSYVLTLLLLFAAIAVMQAGKFRPWLFVVLDGLLANTSLFGMGIAFGLMLLVLWPDLFERKKMRRAPALPLTALGLLAALNVVAFYTALPSPDTTFGPYHFGEEMKDFPATTRLLARITTTDIDLPVVIAPYIHIARPSNLSSWQLHLWNQTHGFEHERPAARWTEFAVTLVSTLTYAITTQPVWGIVFYVLLVVWITTMRAWRQAIPLLIFFLMAFKLGIGEHHLLLMWGTLVATIWLAWPAQEALQQRWIHKVFCVAFLFIVMENVAFTAYAVTFDVRQNFDGAMQASAFLKKTQSTDVAGLGFHAVALQPYFEHNFFSNHRTTFWPWSVSDNPNARLNELIAQRPRYVVVGAGYWGNTNMKNQILPTVVPDTRNDPDDAIQQLEAAGYHETHRFCGAQPMHFGTSEGSCQIVFEPLPVQP